jgi:hypothetical protein
VDYRDYLDLDLAIEADKGAYVASVVDSPAGQASTRFDFPFSAPELAQFIIAVGPPRAGVRRLAPAGARTTDAKQYGRRLFESALSGEVGTCFRLSLDRALSSDKGLRIRLRLSDAPELGTIPWEYLFSEPLDRFLTLSLDTPIVRFVEVAQPIEPLLVEPPIRVLVMVSDPKDAPGLDVQREVELLKATTGDLTASGLMELVFLEDATLANLQHALYERFHVFHFIGHGGVDQDIGEGVLVFEDAQGMAHRVSGSRLGTLLHDARHMQLAVLNACEGARSSLDGTMSSVAQKLVKQGLPAVVAMQFEISDRAAIIFAHEFYFALSRGLPVDAATVEARKAIYISDNEVEWGTPVLFLRTHDARLFELTRQVAAPAPAAHWQSLYDSAVSLLKVGATAAAIPLLEQLAEEKPDFKDVSELLQRAYGGEAPADTVPTDTNPPDSTPPEGGTDVLDETADLGPAPDTVETPRYDDSPDIPAEPEPLDYSYTETRRGPMVVVAGVVTLLLLAVLGGFGAAKLIGRDGGAPTPEPTGTQRPTNRATAAPTGGPATSPARTRPPLVVKRAVVRAPLRPNDPKIDGQGDDWRGFPEYTSTHQVFPAAGRGAPPVTATWQLAWSLDALFVFVDVADPVLTNHEGDVSALWKGDSVSFEFGPDPSGLPADAQLRPTDVHLILGAYGADRTIAVANPARDGNFVSGDEVSDVDVAALVTQRGYTIEAKIPWSVLGVEDTEKHLFGLNLNVSDAVSSGDRTGELAALVSSNGRRTSANQRRPAQWDLLELVVGREAAPTAD